MSLKWRVGVGVAVMLVIVIGVISWVSYVEFRENLLQNLDNLLRAKAQAVAEFLTTSQSLAEARHDIEVLVGSEALTDDTVYRLWWDSQGQAVLASPSWETVPLDWRPAPEQAPAPGGWTFFSTWRGHHPYRGIWLRQQIPRSWIQPSRSANVVLATYSGHVGHETREFLRGLGILGAAVVAVSILLTAAILHWGMRPVAWLGRQMNAISGQNLEQSLPPVPKAPAELRFFVRAWHAMLSRLADAMAAQRRFTCDASHELRTPLAIAKSTLQAARASRRSAEAYEQAIDQALEDLGRLERLIDQLLVLARLERPPDISAWGEVELADLAADVCEQYRPLAAERGSQLLLQALPTVVRGDAEELRRLLGNLVDNAIRHGPPGHEVAVLVHPLSGGRVAVVVHDEGGSIPAEALPHLFERFYRVAAARDRTSGGHGLGLALAQEIARRHGGHIEAASQPGAGTDFTLVLPCAGPSISASGSPES